MTLLRMATLEPDRVELVSDSVERLFVDDDAFFRGTTTIQAADKDGWIVSVTPSGGWVPAFIAGETGIGLSQRMQSFVLDPAENPYNVVEPGKRPRVTLTPSIALRDGEPFLSFAVQGGDARTAGKFHPNGGGPFTVLNMMKPAIGRRKHHHPMSLRRQRGQHAAFQHP